MPNAENDILRETLIDFAEWRGDSPEDAEWAAETYLHKVASSPLSPATRAAISRSTPPAERTNDDAAEKGALIADLLALVRSWEVLHGGVEYGTAVFSVLQEHGFIPPAEPTDEPGGR